MANRQECVAAGLDPVAVTPSPRARDPVRPSLDPAAVPGWTYRRTDGRRRMGWEGPAVRARPQSDRCAAS